MRWIAEAEVDQDPRKALEFDGLRDAYLHFKPFGTRLGGDETCLHVSLGSHEPRLGMTQFEGHTILRSFVGQHVRITVETADAGEEPRRAQRQPGSPRAMSEQEIDLRLGLRSEAWARDASILIQEQRAEINQLTAELDLARRDLERAAR